MLTYLIGLIGPPFNSWAILRFSIEIEIKIFEKSVLLLRLVSRLSMLQSWYWDWYRYFRDCSLDIETGIKTFRNAVSWESLLISVSDERDWVFLSRSRWRLLKNHSCYGDWYQDFQYCSLDIETGIETFRITVLILRLISRLSGLQSWYQDCYRDFQYCSLGIETGIKKFHILIPLPSLVTRLLKQEFFNQDPNIETLQLHSQEWYWYPDFANWSPLTDTRIETMKTPDP